MKSERGAHALTHLLSGYTEMFCSQIYAFCINWWPQLPRVDWPFPSSLSGPNLHRLDAEHLLAATYQRPAEEHRASAVVGQSPGDKLLNVVQLAARFYCPLELVLQVLLEILGDFL